jgi:predicted aconitase with swiveling domain
MVIYLDMLVEGNMIAPLLVLEDRLSFWGGVNPSSGLIIDTQHPNYGQSIAGSCLAMPGIRGSTAAPGALLECIAGGNGPAAVILAESDVAALLASLVAGSIGYERMPVGVFRQSAALSLLKSGRSVELLEGKLSYSNI